MDEGTIDDLMETEYDEHHQRELMREAIEIAAHDAEQGQADPNVRYVVYEPALLTPDYIDTDIEFEWHLQWIDGQRFRVIRPDDEVAGEIELHPDGDLLQIFGEATVQFHRERLIERIKSEEPGRRIGLPLCRSMERLPDGRVAIYTHEADIRDPEPRRVVEMEDLDPVVLQDSFELWQEENVPEELQ